MPLLENHQTGGRAREACRSAAGADGRRVPLSESGRATIACRRLRRRLGEAAWLLPRMLRGLRSTATARTGGRSAGAGHPRLHRARPHDHGAAPRARRQRLAASTAGTWAGTWGARGHHRTVTARLDEISTGRAGPGRRLEPRRGVRPGAGAARVLSGSGGGDARARPFRATRARTTCGGCTSGSPGTRSTIRRCRALPTSRLCRTWPCGRAGTASIAPRAARGLEHERDEEVELDCTPHGVRHVAARGRDRWCAKSTGS